MVFCSRCVGFFCDVSGLGRRLGLFESASASGVGGAGAVGGDVGYAGAGQVCWTGPGAQGVGEFGLGGWLGQ